MRERSNTSTEFQTGRGQLGGDRSGGHWSGRRPRPRARVAWAVAAFAVMAALGLQQAGARQRNGRTKDDRPTCVAVASSHQVITGNNSSKVHQWDLNDLSANPRRYRIDRLIKKVSYVSAATRTNKLLTASYDGIVAISTLSNPGQNAVLFEGHKAGHQPDEVPEVWVVVPSANGNRALSATNDGQILCWTINDPSNIVGTFKASEEWVGGLAFVPVSGGGDETRFVSGHADGKLRVWDISTPAAPTRTFSHGNERLVNSVVVAAESAGGNGRYVVSGSFDGTVRIWDLNNPDDAQMPVTIDRHTDWVWRVALSQDQTKIASAGEDGKVRLFRVPDGAPYMSGAAEAEKSVPDGVMGVAFVGNDKVVYTSGNEVKPEVGVWDISRLDPPPGP